jgi:hypothetical protein
LRSREEVLRLIHGFPYVSTLHIKRGVPDEVARGLEYGGGAHGA